MVTLRVATGLGLASGQDSLPIAAHADPLTRRRQLCQRFDAPPRLFKAHVRRPSAAKIAASRFDGRRRMLHSDLKATPFVEV